MPTMKLHLLTVFLGIIMITSTFSMASSYAFLPDLPEQSQAPNAFASHVRVLEGENLIAYARPLLTSPDNPNNHEVPSGDPHDGVAKLILTRSDGTFGCSGTLAQDNIHVFTAAHCVADDNGIYILQSGSATFEGNNQSIPIAIDASNSVSHPDYDGDYIKGNDIAILKLVSSPSGVPGIPHATTGNEVGSLVEKSGYGISGYFSSGTDSSTYPFGTQRAGQNLYDDVADTMYVELGLTSGVDFIPGAIYQFDSDDGTSGHDAFGFFFGNSDTGLGNDEVMSASGDSGGPTFEGGELVGITSYGITLQYLNKATSDCTKERGSVSLDSSCGEFAGDTRVSVYSDWIATIIGSSGGNLSNVPPVANDDTAETDEDTSVDVDVTLNDTDSDGTIDDTSVVVTTGPSDGSVLVNPTTGVVTYTPDADFNGSDSFVYSVADDGGATDTATVDITIYSVNDAPTADAGSDQTVPDSDSSGVEDVTLNGNGSSDDGTITSYSWEEDGFEIGIGVSPTISFSVGTHEVTLTVTDNDGITDSDIVTITVTEPLPGVSVGSIDPPEGSKGTSVPVTITGSGFVSGAQVTLTNGNGPTPSVTGESVSGDGLTITATINIPNGGPPRSIDWDVTVTNPNSSNDTLVNGFTVNP
jgi:hypothetical protein